VWSHVTCGAPPASRLNSTAAPGSGTYVTNRAHFYGETVPVILNAECDTN